MNDNKENAVKAFERLYDIIHTLRADGGCPWDRNQTPLSMRRDLMEETFEAIDAITNEDILHTKEELGDVILNATMIAYMHEQNEDFCIADSLNELCDKLVRRHPHVFSESEGKIEEKEKATTSEDVLNQWDRIKQNVEGRKGNSILDEVPQGFPPLLKSYKMLKKAGKKGFEWSDVEEVKDKIKEEWYEVLEAEKDVNAISSPQKAFTVQDGNEKINNAQLHLEEEIGDFLMSTVNYARWLNIDPVIALDRANRKFYRRFTYVEKYMEKNNIPMDKNHIEEMLTAWKMSKTNLK